MQVPTKQPRFEFARVEKCLDVPLSIPPTGSVGFRQIAPWATERQVSHHRLTALGPRADMLDVILHPASGFKEPAILTGPTSAGRDELTVRVSRRHPDSPRPA